MKQVQVLTPFNEKADYLMLETFDDVDEYSDQLTNGVEVTLARLVTSKVAIDRWDHMLGRDDQDGIMCGAIMTAHCRGTNPLYEAEPLVRGKIQHIGEYIGQGEIVLVNKNGGFCILTDDYKILSEEEAQTPEPFEVAIHADTKYINLENDPNLEPNAINYLNKVDVNYSYVTQLHNVSVEKLKQILIDFQAEGGEVVYIYTTGYNVNQMYDYGDAIIASGIDNVEFKFVDEITQKHKEFINHLEGYGVEVKIL